MSQNTIFECGGLELIRIACEGPNNFHKVCFRITCPLRTALLIPDDCNCCRLCGAKILLILAVAVTGASALCCADARCPLVFTLTNGGCTSNICKIKRGTTTTTTTARGAQTSPAFKAGSAAEVASAHKARHSRDQRTCLHVRQRLAGAVVHPTEKTSSWGCHSTHQHHQLMC